GNVLERYGHDLKLIISPSAKLWISKISLIVSGEAANNNVIAEHISNSYSRLNNISIIFLELSMFNM
ncbi:hypothetical protein, partial [Companilactobacillus paralimentarius]